MLKSMVSALGGAILDTVEIVLPRLVGLAILVLIGAQALRWVWSL